MLLAAVSATPQRAAWAQAGGTPLIDAAARGDLAAAQRAAQTGAPLEARDAGGRTALLAATQGGHSAVARWLIERGADVNAQDNLQDSAFLLAGARGHTEIVRAAHAKADPKVLNRYGGTALIPACHYGHVETVRALLEYRGPNKVPIDHVNRLGWTALLEAVILGDGGPRHTEIVRLLIQHGANVNLADHQGVTPLAHARQRKQQAIVALLEKAGGR
ncbi:MAG: ankyrin repeat domain-containing protein [Rubrivivax sp.]|nr:ankyrin repeat domain-containing protein [Rubrivivax sp.]